MDPRLIDQPGLGESKLTVPMRQAKAAAKGERLNLCPCGCDDKELTEHDYCKHLVGFSNDGKTVELREIVNEPGKSPYERVGRETRPIGEDDHLVQITTSYRVYHGKLVVKAKPTSDVAALQDQAAAQQVKI